MLRVLTADRARREAELAQERLDSYEPPILMLPNEITLEIFIRFLPIYPLCPPLTGLLSPTLLTHICRRWREIALGTPELWRAIRFSHNHDIPFKRQVDIADLWLRRCPYSSLSVHIDDPVYNWPEVFAKILSHRARWEYIKFDLFVSHFPTIAGPMPLLRQLDLMFINDGIEDPALFPASCELPLLRTAILHHSAPAKIILPWAQLTSLILNGLYPRDCVPILQQTPNLEHCELGLVDEKGDLPDIVLPCLRVFTLRQKSLPEIHYLHTIIAPALQNLEIPESFLESNQIDALTLFISKSGCKLREVRITGRRWIEKDAYRAAFPSIQMFSFDNEIAE
ncbi:hypothetical protein B0H13DRAFT_2348200 [Mycena leptocephala]|nr:hypothetical protein B0H13DRAFT_2348200 [Mycena leptocephala]